MRVSKSGKVTRFSYLRFDSEEVDCNTVSRNCMDQLVFFIRAPISVTGNKKSHEFLEIVAS